jgi:23S rRNA (guanosine2251-2'-O)-methyltransferase
MTAAPTQRVVYGVHAVTEALRRGKGHVAALLVQDEGADVLAPLRPLLQKAGLTPIERPPRELDRLAHGGVHQGLIALCGEYAYASVDDILARAQAEGAAPLVLVLDGVTDPQNLGALLRSAYVLGAHGVVLPQDRAAPVSPAVVKASSGASELLPVARVVNVVRTLAALRQAGLWLYAAALGQDARPPWAADLRGPSALVLGSEGKGIRPLVRKSCDLILEIPMAPGLRGASLNVSAAGAALLYEALRQRHTGPAAQQIR